MKGIDKLIKLIEDDPEWAIQVDDAELIGVLKYLSKIEKTARALKFSAYPAHGSGFVITVTGGNINELEDALAGK